MYHNQATSNEVAFFISLPVTTIRKMPLKKHYLDFTMTGVSDRLNMTKNGVTIDFDKLKIRILAKISGLNRPKDMDLSFKGC